MFPSFCNYPLDTAESFKDMEKALCTTLHEEPNLCGIVCSSLQILIQQNKGILEQKIDANGSDSSTYRQRAMARYTPQVAADNLTVIKSCAREFLPILSGKFLKSAQDGGCLQVLEILFVQLVNKMFVPCTAVNEFAINPCFL